MNILERYNGVQSIKSDKNREIYPTILYPTIDPDPIDIWTVVYENDRLDLLAYKYYGDVRYWWIIAIANNLGKGSMLVNPETRLRIPKNLNKIINDYNALNADR
jgi:hypothetical protein